MPIARVPMPQMGSSVHSGTVIEWLRKEGDEVRKGEPLLVAQSEKVEFEVEAPYSGRLARVLAAADATVPVGEAVALIETQEAVPPEGKPPPETAREPDRGQPAAEGRHGFLSPRVKRLAAEAGVGLEELSRIPGTGSGGRVTEEDLRRYLGVRSAGGVSDADFPPDEAERVPLTPMRRKIAQRMAESVRTIPQYTTFDAADVSAIVAWRKGHGEKFLARTGVPLTYTPFVARAVVSALLEPEFKALNSRWTEEAIFLFRSVHLGFAVALEEGLIVPVARGAEKLGFIDLCRSLQLLADRARQGTLRPEEAAGGSFTLTNVGATGSLFATPLINPPEVAILGIGAIQKQLVVLRDDSTAIRDRMGLSLTADHRVVDGWVAARFNRAVCERLEGFDFAELNAVVTGEKP
ncbi:MAG: 2-oxo acid dehydrogenase subunit E2 [Candidatus Tectomicrobia bacterium]|nr:2-oxo acid dehydrogenase subunit E2 [Candidatus Tectomicrobia bacterium]